MKSAPRYHFAEVPNDADGKAFIDGLKRYVGPAYRVRVRGQHLKPELAANGGWKRYTFGQSIDKSTHLRVYLEEKKA